MKSSVADQESRRARMLEHQKSKRDDLVRAHFSLRLTSSLWIKVNLARALAMGDFEDEGDEEEEEEEMDTTGGEVGKSYPL